MLPPVVHFSFFLFVCLFLFLGGGGGGGGRLFEAGRLLTFLTYRVGAYSRWALIQEVGRLIE